MPMEREKYPDDWERIAREVKDEAGWRCEECGKQCRKPGEPFDTHRRTLTVSHVDHDPSNCSRDNLRALCAPCHLRYDARHHAETRRRRKELTERGEAMMARLREVEASLVDDTGQTTYSEMLLQCPFCGGRAWIQYWPYPDDMGYEARAVCGDCHVSTSRDYQSGRVTYLPTGEDITRLLAIEKAIQTWNRRS